MFPSSDKDFYTIKILELYIDGQDIKFFDGQSKTHALIFLLF